MGTRRGSTNGKTGRATRKKTSCWKICSSHLLHNSNQFLRQQSCPPPSFPPLQRAYIVNNQPTSTSASNSESAADDLTASMHRTNLDPANSEKKQKTSNHMNLDENHPSYRHLPGDSNKGTSQSRETHISTSSQHQSRTTTCSTTNHQSNNTHNHIKNHTNNNHNNDNKNINEIHHNDNTFTKIGKLFRQQIVAATNSLKPTMTVSIECK